jgi:hypothetical protein
MRSEMQQYKVIESKEVTKKVTIHMYIGSQRVA